MNPMRAQSEETWRSTSVGEHAIASRHHSTPGAPALRRQVVLVHGLVVSSSYHVPLAERLVGRADVHAPDLPGFGRSGRPRHALDTRELGQALAGWLDAQGLAAGTAGRSLTLVGNSYGCQVIAETLLARPDLADRVVLLAPTMERSARRVDEQLRRWRREQRTQSRRLQGLLAHDYLSAGLGRAVATFRHALADAIEEKLPFIAQPTLVCRGSRDPIVSHAWAEEVTRCLPDGHLARLPGAPHAMNHETPLQTARVIDAFLTRTAAPT